MLSLWLLVAVACQLQPGGAPSPGAAGDGQSGGGQAAGVAAERPAGQAEIVQTQVPAFSAVVRAVEPEGLRVELASDSRLIPFDQLLRARFAGGEKKRAGHKVVAELADGSSVFCAQVTSDGKNVTFSWPDREPMSMPAQRVTSCLIRPLPPALARQWQAIVESRVTSDVLVVQRSSEALDKIEGVIGQITEAAVKFQFDGQSIDVQRSKLAGWRYFAPEPQSRPKLLAVVRDHHGSSWMAQSLAGNWSGADAKIELKLLCGAEVQVPAGAINEIDFSFGSMRFLADLEPIERRTEPRLALATALPAADELFGPRPAEAETLRGATAGPGIDFMGSGSIVYRVPGDFHRLLGSVALTPDGPQFVPCKAQVLVEEKVVWEKTLTAPHESLPIEIEVEPGKRVRLTVEAQSRQPVGDKVSWRQLRFVK
ncbi:MAG: NPCBM/NEW2 domain-containing protein [Aureliella sp.]